MGSEFDDGAFIASSSGRNRRGLICDVGALTEAMRTGNVEVLDRLTRCFGERLLATGRRYCRNEEEAQDAVQDALLSATTHLRSFRGDGSVEGWLVRMVIHACSHRRRGRKNDPSIHETEMPVMSELESPELLAHRSSVADIVGRALLGLPPKDRAILLLAEGEGWTGPEIAAEMGLTPTAVRVRLTRIRAKLRQELGSTLQGWDA